MSHGIQIDIPPPSYEEVTYGIGYSREISGTDSRPDACIGTVSSSSDTFYSYTPSSLQVSSSQHTDFSCRQNPIVYNLASEDMYNCEHHGQRQTPGPRNSFSQYTYCTIQSGPDTTSGNQYMMAGGMDPVQSSCCSCFVWMYAGNSARRHFAISFLVVICFLIFFSTVLFVIIFVVLRPTPEL